ncbi:GAP family protein [Haladaptatus halobius]|uniref:GAP family protein n=1 Tax=Haladaptatus halobius TaxID=2884875 RepID=UPI001D0AF56D|nr:GAP family protein [Haladaptatus halobius]
MSFLRVLPLAFVMIAGPQFLSAIFLATSENWRRNSAAFIFGAALSITLLVSLAYFLGIGANRQRGSNTTLSVIVLVILLVAMVHTYLTRKESEPPKWMGTLTTANPRFAFRLGFLLLGFFPSDILTSVAVGSYLAANGLPWTDSLGFIALTVFFLSLPSLVLLGFGKRAEAVLPRVREWMNANSWVVSEVVILLFVGMILNDLLG